MPAAPRSPKSIPLRWVVAAVVVFLLGYKFLRLHYGKPGRAFEPYENAREHAAAARLVALGYRRIPVQIQRPAEPFPADHFAPRQTELVGALGGLPAEMAGGLTNPPELPASVTGVAAPREAGAGSYTLQFRCAQPDYRSQIHDVVLFRKDRQLFLLPDFERIAGDLRARWKESVVVASFPTDGLAPGRYTVTLCGRQASISWAFTVKGSDTSATAGR